MTERSLKFSFKGKHPADSTSSSESDVPRPKHFKYSDSTIGKDVKDIKKQLSSLLTIDKTLRIPFSLHLLLIDNFKCSICQDVLEPPVIFSRCCKYLIGCEKCVDRWYECDGRNSKPCPQCGAERSYSETCRLYGIDDFLRGIKKLVMNMENPEGTSASN